MTILKGVKAEPKRAYRNLADFFEKGGTKQEDFAAELGVSASHVSMLVNGHREPSLSLALRIAELANVPVESLVRSEGADENQTVPA